MESLTEDQILQRADAAERLRADPLLKDTLDRMERDVMEAWAKCSFDDKDGIMELSRLIKTTRKFRDMFDAYVSHGKYTEAQLREHDEEKVSAIGRFARRFRNS